MRRILERYRRWRASDPLRYGSMILAVAFTVFSLVVLPGQWVPVLFRDDLTVIATSLVILGLGGFVAAASLSRREPTAARGVLARVLAVTLILIAFAVALYKAAFGGIGWPGPLELLIGLAFVLGCSAVGVQAGKLSRDRPRPLLWLLTSGGVVALASIGIWLFMATLPKAMSSTYSEADQVCETRNGISYCANPGYEPFIDEWQPVVERVLAASPIAVDPSEMRVAQMLDVEGRRVVHSSVAPGLDWGRGSGKGVSDLILGLEVANWVTGIESREIVFDPDEDPATCAGGNGSRAVVAYWLAGHASAHAADVVDGLGCCADAINGSTFGAPAIGGGWEIAGELLKMPREEVGRTLATHWDRITAPETSVTLLDEIFDLSVPVPEGDPLEPGFTLCESRIG